MTKKFNCTFSVKETIEKTYIATNLSINIPEEDLDGHKLTLEDIVEDEILNLLQEGILSLDDYTLVGTDHDIGYVKLVKTPKEIKKN